MNTDASILVYKFRPERTGFNMYAEYTQLQLTFLALVPCFQINSAELTKFPLLKIVLAKYGREVNKIIKARAAVIHWNFRVGSTFPVPVCTVPPGHCIG